MTLRLGVGLAVFLAIGLAGAFAWDPSAADKAARAAAQRRREPQSKAVLIDEGVFICKHYYKDRRTHRLMLWTGEGYAIGYNYHGSGTVSLIRLTVPEAVRAAFASHVVTRHFFRQPEDGDGGGNDGSSWDLRVATREFSHQVRENNAHGSVTDGLSAECAEIFALRQERAATPEQLQAVLGEIRKRAEALDENDRRRILLRAWLAEQEPSSTGIPQQCPSKSDVSGARR